MPEKLAKCPFCPLVIPCRSKRSSRGVMRSHLRDMHAEEYAHQVMCSVTAARVRIPSNLIQSAGDGKRKKATTEECGAKEGGLTTHGPADTAYLEPRAS